MLPPIPESWQPVLEEHIRQPYYEKLEGFVESERQRHAVYPPTDEVFAALRLTAYPEVKVLLLGQDPYHGPNQAHGLSFSVRPGTPPPPSLVNIFKELREDTGFRIPNHGFLAGWAAQGVLLLNAVLTVRANQANSHKDRGWEIFTDAVIRAVGQKEEPVVFLLWGAYAQKKRALIDGGRHVILTAPHPSPLSAHRGFFGCRHFSKTNTALKQAGRPVIEWQLDNV